MCTALPTRQRRSQVRRAIPARTPRPTAPQSRPHRLASYSACQPAGHCSASSASVLLDCCPRLPMPAPAPLMPRALAQSSGNALHALHLALTYLPSLLGVAPSVPPSPDRAHEAELFSFYQRPFPNRDASRNSAEFTAPTSRYSRAALWQRERVLVAATPRRWRFVRCALSLSIRGAKGVALGADAQALRRQRRDGPAALCHPGLALEPLPAHGPLLVVHAASKRSVPLVPGIAHPGQASSGSEATREKVLPCCVTRPSQPVAARAHRLAAKRFAGVAWQHSTGCELRGGLEQAKGGCASRREEVRRGCIVHRGGGGRQELGRAEPHLGCTPAPCNTLQRPLADGAPMLPHRP